MASTDLGSSFFFSYHPFHFSVFLNILSQLGEQDLPFYMVIYVKFLGAKVLSFSLVSRVFRKAPNSHQLPPKWFKGMWGTGRDIKTLEDGTNGRVLCALDVYSRQLPLVWLVLFVHATACSAWSCGSAIKGNTDFLSADCLSSFHFFFFFWTIC